MGLIMTLSYHTGFTRGIPAGICATEPPQDQPDILPAASQIYARRVAELSDALNHPGTRAESADQLRVLIEKIVLTPGSKRGEVYARLHGDLATILEWVARQDGQTGTKSKTPGAERSGVLVSVVAGARNQRYLRLVEQEIPKLAA